jgi:GT2 family glycosyltransferase
LYPNGNIQHAGMLIGYYGGRNRGRGEQYAGQYDKIEEMDGVTFAVALINKKVIEKVGLLDENFVNGYEDTDYCIRTKKAGFKIIYNGEVKLLHLEGFSVTKVLKIESFYYYQRNFIYFMKKHPELFNLKNKILGFLVYFFASIFSIEGENRKRSIFSIRLKDKSIERLKLSIKAFKDAQKLQIKENRN